MLNRSAFRLVFPVDIAQGGYDQADVTIDAETGAVLVLSTSLAGQPFMRWETKAISLSPDLRDFSFVIPSESGDDVSRVDEGFVDTQLSLVESKVGYRPLVPKTLPEGYSLSQIVTKRAKGEPTGANGANPESENVVSALYKGSGWSRLFVTTRSTAGPSGRWSDPIAIADGEYAATSKTVTVESGALAKSTAQVAVAPTGTPHMWAASEAVVATVSGPFSSEVLESIFNSLTA